MEFILRDYQEEASNKIVELFNSEKGGKELFVLPTGSGKSLIIADAVKNFGGPVLIIQPSKELLVQNYRKFKSFGGEATICCASLKEKTVDGEDYFEIEPGEWKKCREISEVTFATVGTVKKYIEELKDLDIKHVVIDETHIGSRKGSQLRKLLDKLKIRHVAGLTATPLYLEGGMNGSRLIMMNRAQHTIFRKISYVSQISEMVKRKFWSPLKYEIHDQDESSLKLNSSGSDFTDNSMRTFYRDNDIETSIINEVNKQLKEGRKRILIFMPSIEDAENLHNLIPVKSGIVHSKMSMKERDANVRMFGNGDIKIMINVNVLSVGYDNPLIDSIITCRPTSSMEIYLQQCLDEKTEILTTNGFKGVDDISIGDTVYSYNMDTSEIIEDKVLKVFDRVTDGREDIISYESNRIDFRVTEHHDMIFKSRKSKNYRKDFCNEMLKLKSGMSIPVSGLEKVKNSGLTKYELMFLGWFLSDGSYNKKNNVVSISQSVNSPYIDEIEMILEKCGFRYGKYIHKRNDSKYSDLAVYTISRTTNDKGKTGWKKLEKYINKDMPLEAYNNLSRSDLKYLLVALIHGDGRNKTIKSYKVRTHQVCIGKNEIFKDNLQSLLSRRGYYNKVVTSEWDVGKTKFNKTGKQQWMYILYFKDTEHVHINGINDKNGHIGSKKEYKRSRIKVHEGKKERVWCVKTGMGSVVIRRNGKVMITGNCGRGVRIHPNKKDCKIVDFSGNVKRFGNIEEFHFEDLEGYGWGLFNGKNELLTDYPIQSKIRPTKETLIQAHKEKLALEGNEDHNDNITFYFGKFKNKTLGFVYKYHKDYLVWIADQENFNWYGKKGEVLRNAIFKKLMLPIPKGHFEIDESWRDKKEEERDNKLDKLLEEFNIDRPF